jgi:predicted MFS family arabinose efflux permease
LNKDTGASWDLRYEWKAVALMSVGFGLVGIDRFMIMPMFPVMAKDLGLDYQDMGHIAAALALAWGVAAMFVGNLSDHIGRRKVLIPALILFSLLVGVSGLATGVASLLVVRALMGFAEGAFVPASITATMEASKPVRHGMNVGIQQMMTPLLGLGLAPILVTQLMLILSWRWIFVLVSLPGFICAYLVYKVLRERDAKAMTVHTATHDAREHKWTDVFRYRNVALNMVGMLCWLTCLIVTSALLPNYLTDYLHLNMQQMGFILSAVGLGASLGSVVMPAISDRIGRKPVMIISVLGAIGFLWLMMESGPNPGQLFLHLFMTAFFNFALICLTVGPISAESVPVKLMATASGLVIGVGELFGGAAAPALAGFVAKTYGIQYILYLAMGGLLIGLIVAISLKETAPCRVK